MQKETNIFPRLRVLGPEALHRYVFITPVAAEESEPPPRSRRRLQKHNTQELNSTLRYCVQHCALGDMPSFANLNTARLQLSVLSV